MCRDEKKRIFALLRFSVHGSAVVPINHQGAVESIYCADQEPDQGCRHRQELGA
jgi:hypothetical protein